MREIHELINKIKESDCELWQAGPAYPDAVQELESKLGVLPEQLKNFLLTYGAIGVGDNFISGIVGNQALAMEGGNIYADTQFLNQSGYSLPVNYVVVNVHEDGAYCIKVGAPHSPVYNFERGSLTKVASSFNEFLVSFFLSRWA